MADQEDEGSQQPPRRRPLLGQLLLWPSRFALLPDISWLAGGRKDAIKARWNKSARVSIT
jgi:hypothetical protein